MQKLLSILLLGLAIIHNSNAQNPELVSFSPAHEAVGVALDANLTVTFNEPIEINTTWTSANRPELRLKRLDNDQFIRTIAPSVTTEGLSVEGNVLTIDLPDDLLPGISYYIEITWRVIQDLDGNYFDGFIGNSTWNFMAATPDVTITDNDFKAHLVSLVDAAGGGNNDGEVQEAEAETLTQLFYHGQGLTDATGLEAFVNLTNLNMYDNELTSINLSTLTKLESVNLKSNNLTTIDVSNCPLITYLQVYDNELSSLNVSTLTSLGTLQANTNNLTSIDVSNNLLLTSLVLYDNELTTLNVSANIELTGLSVYDNLLTDLNVSNNELLVSLGAYNNNLGSIDLSNNTELTSLHLYGAGLTAIDISHNTKLESLLLNDNSLSAIDLSANTKISDLRLHSNELTSLDLSTNIELTLASLYDNELTAIDFSQNPLLDLMSVAQNNITSIDLSDNPELISCVIAENPIKFLDVSSNAKLLKIMAYDCDLHSLTIKNGMNSSISTVNFDISGNENLTCVEVSDVTYAEANWTSKDAGANFSAACVPTALNFSPSKSSSGVPISSNLTVTFSEPMKFYDGASTKSIFLYDSDGAQVRNYPSNNPGSNLSIIENVLTVDLGADLEYGTSYNVRIFYGALEDLSGNAYAGIASHLTWTFTTEDAPDVVWDGSEWNNEVGPSATDNVVIDEDYTTSLDGSISCNNLTTSSGKSLIVDGGHTLTVNGNVINDGSITIESGASLITFSGKTVTGNWIDIKRNTRYSGGKYSFVGTPMMLSSFNTGTSIGNTTYEYNEYIPYGANEGLERWEEITNTHIRPGRGYAQAFKKEITFTGFPNRGSVIYSGTYTEDTDDANEGWNLVSNPYAAAINVQKFLYANANTTGSVYIWDDNGSSSQRGTNSDYIVANGTMASSTQMDVDVDRYNDHLVSAQGFFVKIKDDVVTRNILFTESMREVGNNSDNNFFRKTELPIVRLNLTNNEGLFKQAVIGFAEDATEDELNRTYDAHAFNTMSGDGLFTVKAGRSLTLNGMTANWESIQLQLNTKEAGLYTISVELEEYNQSLYLMDNLTNKVVDLRDENYTFSASAGIDTDRFQLLSSPQNILGLNENEVLVYAYNNILHIQSSDDSIREYLLFNMNGKQLLNTSVKAKAEISLSDYPAGIYLVFDGIKTHKILLD